MNRPTRDQINKAFRSIEKNLKAIGYDSGIVFAHDKKHHAYTNICWNMSYESLMNLFVDIIQQNPYTANIMVTAIMQTKFIREMPTPSNDKMTVQ